MKTSIRTFLLASALSSLALPAHAQGFYWSLAYEPSVPLGSVRNVSGKASPAGASFSARYLFTKYYSLGIGTHWNQFAENYPRGTYPIDEGAITGAVFRRVWIGSVMPEAYFYLAPEDAVNPYLGIGAGVAWMSNEILVSDLTFDASGTGFTVSPEAGILIAFDRDPMNPERTAMQSIVLGARYAYSTAGARDVSATSLVALTLGVLVF
jgi:opacity protein-like surface antigen